MVPEEVDQCVVQIRCLLQTAGFGIVEWGAALLLGGIVMVVHRVQPHRAQRLKKRVDLRLKRRPLAADLSEAFACGEQGCEPHRQEGSVPREVDFALAGPRVRGGSLGLLDHFEGASRYDEIVPVKGKHRIVAGVRILTALRPARRGHALSGQLQLLCRLDLALP